MSYVADTTAALPPPGGTHLVVDRREREALNAHRETDSRDALMRGLREYLEQQSLEWSDGQQIRFRAVREDWAEPEDNTTFPALALRAAEPLAYDDDCGDNAIITIPGPGAGTQLMRVAQCRLNLIVESWSQDAEQRRAVQALLEDALNPVDWMYGFRLVLPHYHNAMSSWSAWDVEYQDTEEDRARRYVKATMRVSGYVREYRVLGAGVQMRPRVKLVVDGIPFGNEDD